MFGMLKKLLIFSLKIFKKSKIKWNYSCNHKDIGSPYVIAGNCETDVNFSNYCL